jgi:ABC-type nitrate/sulfonate/bicarbonate transport system substrate-binding protein
MMMNFLQTKCPMDTNLDWLRFLAASSLLVVRVLSFSVLAQTKDRTSHLPTKSFGYLPLFVAQENGFYKDESLEVIAPVVRSAAALPGLLSGEIHFASAESGMRVAMRGTPLKAIIFYYDRATWIFMGVPKFVPFVISMARI